MRLSFQMHMYAYDTAHPKLGRFSSRWSRGSPPRRSILSGRLWNHSWRVVFPSLCGCMGCTSSNSKLKRLPPARRVPPQPPRLSLPAGRPLLGAGWDAALPPPVDPVDGSVAAAAAAAAAAAVVADVVASERHNEVVRAALSEYRRIGYAPQLGAAALSGRSTVAETCNQMHQRCAVWLQGASDPATRLEDSVRDQLTAFVKQLRDKLEGAPPARPGHESGEPVLPTPRASQCCAPLAGKGPTAGLCRVTGALDCSDAKNPGPEVPGRCKRHLPAESSRLSGARSKRRGGICGRDGEGGRCGTKPCAACRCCRRRRGRGRCWGHLSFRAAQRRQRCCFG